jgi:hypothetical protein
MIGPIGKTHGHPGNCTCEDCKRKAFLTREGRRLSEAVHLAVRSNNEVEADQLLSQLEEVNTEAANL